MIAHATPKVGVVLIGRNEGQRLRRCIASVLTQAPAKAIVYVDSGSTDGSPELARRMGVDVIELDSSRPLSAARARNAGFERLMHADWRRAPEFVQFVDGDCELCDGWIDRARSAIAQDECVAIVCGVLRERNPENSVYNRLCDMEWAGAVGDISSTGGLFMVRAEAFREAGAFKTAMIAGEEPDLCARLRKGGWRVRRIDAEMAIHDAAMTRFRQWWRRTTRSGHAWAELAALHGLDGTGGSLRQVLSAIGWGLLLPLLALGAAWPTGGWSLLAFAVYPIQWWRIRNMHKRRGFSSRDSNAAAFYMLLGKFAQVVGLMHFVLARVRRRPTPVMDYKTPVPQSTRATASAGASGT